MHDPPPYVVGQRTKNGAGHAGILACDVNCTPTVSLMHVLGPKMSPFLISTYVRIPALRTALHFPSIHTHRCA